MINHLRTLLLDVDGRSAQPAGSYPGEELVDTDYRALNPTGELSRMKGLLFGGRPDRALQNLRLFWYMSLLHSDPFYEQYVTTPILDSRITYLPLRQDAFFNWFLSGPSIAVQVGSSSTNIQVLGYNQTIGDERLYHQWTVTVVNSTDLEITYFDDATNQNQAVTQSYTTAGSGMAGPVDLPGSVAGLSILFEPVVSTTWRITTVLKPARKFAEVARSILSSIDTALEAELFNPSVLSEPRHSFTHRWNQVSSSRLLDRLALVLLAYAWKMEDLRSARESS